MWCFSRKDVVESCMSSTMGTVVLCRGLRCQYDQLLMKSGASSSVFELRWLPRLMSLASSVLPRQF